MLNPTAAAKTVVAEARTIEANGGLIAYTFYCPDHDREMSRRSVQFRMDVAYARWHGSAITRLSYQLGVYWFFSAHKTKHGDQSGGKTRCCTDTE